MQLGRTTTMRTAVLTLLGSLVLSAAAMPANAGPAIAKPGAPTVSNVIQVSGGCGQRYYRDVYGYCSFQGTTFLLRIDPLKRLNRRSRAVPGNMDCR